MTLANDLTSMYANTKDVYDALEGLGATMPEHKNLENLVATIENVPGIGGGGYDPDNPTIQGIKAAIDAGDYEAFPANTTIPDTYNGNAFNWVVGQYGTATMSDGSTRDGVYLFADQIVTTRDFGSNVYYDESTINTWLNDTFLPACSQSVQNIVGQIQVPVYNDRTINAKVWLMSVGEILARGPHATNGSGEPWDAWKIRTGLTTASTTANSGRIMKDSTGAAGQWWTRSYSNPTSVWVVLQDGGVYYDSPSLAEGIVPAMFIPGKEPELPDAPDLSKVLTKSDLDDIQAIVAAGAASEKFNLGDELLVSYGSYTMPFEIVGFEPVEVEGGKTVPAINLLAKYTSETDSQWGTSGSTKYSASALRSSITTYQGKLNADFLACLANTKTQTYSRDGSTDIVYDKLFAPSMAQLGVTNTVYNNAQQAAVEGPAFTAYQGASNAKRVKQAINATSTTEVYWTRSLYSSISTFFGIIQPSGAPDYYNFSNTARVVVACNLIGNTSTASNESVKSTLTIYDYPVGTEIEDTYAGESNPLIVAQHLDSSNNADYGGAVGTILVRKYPEPLSKYGTLDYTTSTVKEVLDTTYLENCSDSTKAMIGDITVPYYNGTENVGVTGKWFLMSDAEVMGANGAGVEGIGWDYWKQQTGLTTPSAANNTGRAIKKRDGGSSYNWLRSRYDNSYPCYINYSGSIGYTNASKNYSILPACFVPA